MRARPPARCAKRRKLVAPLNVSATGAATAQLTRTGAIVGTPAYLAPEQATGGELGPWTDLYALGLVMAEALSGEPVYKSGGLIACMEQASPTRSPSPTRRATARWG